VLLSENRFDFIVQSYQGQQMGLRDRAAMDETDVECMRYAFARPGVSAFDRLAVWPRARWVRGHHAHVGGRMWNPCWPEARLRSVGALAVEAVPNRR
jgi:hypothetical protein